MEPTELSGKALVGQLKTMSSCNQSSISQKEEQFHLGRRHLNQLNKKTGYVPSVSALTPAKKACFNRVARCCIAIFFFAGRVADQPPGAPSLTHSNSWGPDQKEIHCINTSVARSNPSAEPATALMVLVSTGDDRVLILNLQFPLGFQPFVSRIQSFFLAFTGC